MGISALAYFVTKKALTDSEIEFLQKQYFKHFGFIEDHGYHFRSLRTQKEFTSKCVEIKGMDRVYEANYPKGPFLSYLCILGWLSRRKDIEAVFYGGDTYDLDEASEWTKNREEELLEHFLSPRDGEEI